MMKSVANSPTLNTACLLMAQYGGKAIIPVEEVCREAALKEFRQLFS
jgi:hypothetical protein